MAYLPLSTANLPDPVIDPAQGASPEDYFNTVLYTGDSASSHAITGVGFQPDWVWIKRRNAAYSHRLFDAVRTSSYYLSSDTANAESSAVGIFSSFDSDGFTVNGTSNATNNSAGTFTAWNWKANGSGVTNNVGSITSTVSANTESGFSIVSYTGDDAASATVGHGLSQAPEMVIVKNRQEAISNPAWPVYHSSLGATKFLDLQTTAAEGTATSVWNDTAPTSSLVTIGTADSVNSGSTHIMYCFHSVEGFSKFGSYTGNGSTDGPFVYTGFRPAFVMFKKTNGAGDWNIRDTSRSPSNTVGQALYPNLSFVEYSGTETYVDILSNGFKLRGNWNSTNASGGTYIYACFSENPFKYSNAR